MTRSEATATTGTIDHYATEIMDMIGEDMLEGVMPKSVVSFEELHEHVDANEYMIQADVPWSPDDETAMTFYVAVQDEVTARLARRATVLAVGSMVRFYLGETPELHDGVITEAYRPDGEDAGLVTVRGDDGVQRMLAVSDIRANTDEDEDDA